MQPFAFESKYVKCPSAFLQFGRYRNGAIALMILDANNGDHLTTATVNLEAYGEMPDEGNVFIYGDYSEHEGVWEGLYKAGIVGEVSRRIPYGPYDAEAYECKLLQGIIK